MKESPVAKCMICKKELYLRDKGDAWSDDKPLPVAVCLHHTGVKELIEKSKSDVKKKSRYD